MDPGLGDDLQGLLLGASPPAAAREADSRGDCHGKGQGTGETGRRLQDRVMTPIYRNGARLQR